MRPGRRPRVVVSSGQSSALSAFALENSGGGGQYLAQRVWPDMPLTGCWFETLRLPSGGFVLSGLVRFRSPSRLRSVTLCPWLGRGKGVGSLSLGRQCDLILHSTRRQSILLDIPGIFSEYFSADISAGANSLEDR